MYAYPTNRRQLVRWCRYARSQTGDGIAAEPKSRPLQMLIILEKNHSFVTESINILILILSTPHSKCRRPRLTRSWLKTLPVTVLCSFWHSINAWANHLWRPTVPPSRSICLVASSRACLYSKKSMVFVQANSRPTSCVFAWTDRVRPNASRIWRSCETVRSAQWQSRWFGCI